MPQTPTIEKPRDGGFWLQPILGFLGGGAVGGLVTMFGNFWMERNRRKGDLLKMQLCNLYGPLQFFVSSNQEIFKHAYRIEQAGQNEFGGPVDSELRTKKIHATIDVNNEFFELVKTHNSRMLEILTNHYDLIEPEDAEAFAQFAVDCFRRNVEFDQTGKWKVPLDLHSHLPPIHSLSPEFANVVNRRFNEKSTDLRRLVSWRVFPFSWASPRKSGQKE